MKNVFSLGLIFWFLILSSSTFSADEKTRRGQFSTIKSEALKRLENRRASLDDGIACIEAAQNNKELKECRKEMKDSRPKRRR